MPVRATCTICFDDYPIKEFRVYRCGHCFCASCVSSLKEQRDTKCPVCREPVSPQGGKQLYLNVIESSVEKAEWVIEGVRRMDVDTEATSVQRARKEIEKVIDDAGRTGSDVLRKLLQEVQAFQERIIPLFEAREKLAADCAELHSKLSTTEASLSLKTRCLKQLEGEENRLKQQLSDASRVTDNAVAVAEKTKNALVLAREEKTACLAKWEVDKQAKEEHEAEARKLRDWLEEHKKDARLMKDKYRAMKKQFTRLKTARHDDYDDSLSVVGNSSRIHHVQRPNAYVRSWVQEQERENFDSDLVTPSDSSPYRSPSPVLNAACNNRQLAPEPIPICFTSEWHLPRKTNKKRRLEGAGGITTKRFPIKLDERGHAKGVVQLGSRQRRLE